MDIIGVITQTIQSLGVIMILGGMLIAFLWKAAAIINFVFGFIITIIFTYIVFTVTGNLVGTGIIFLVGMGATVVMAALGAITCILEGFVLSAVGFWGAMVAGSPSSAFTSNSIIAAVVASIFSTAVAVFIGGRILSAKTYGIGKKSSRPSYSSPRRVTNSEKVYFDTPQKPYLEKPVEKPAPITVEILPEKTIESPTESFPKTTPLVDTQAYLLAKEKVQKQIERLKTEAEKGKISPETANKLLTELQKELVSVDNDFADSLQDEICELNNEKQEIEREITVSNTKMESFEQARKEILTQRNELEARFTINQIEKKEYKSQKKTFEQEIEEMNTEITKNTTRNQRLIDRKNKIETELVKGKKELETFANRLETNS